jgi:hypothetical protein
MEDKYYTPSIEDLRVGYECEWIKDHNKECSDDNLVKIVFGPKLLAAALFSPMNWEREETDNLVPNLMSYRTPYLTKEQIEAEGWLHVGGKLLKTATQEFEKTVRHGVMTIHYNADQHSLIITRGEQPTGYVYYYVGSCPSINEFRTICKLLGI